MRNIDTDNIYSVAEQFERTANTLASQMGTSGTRPPVSPFIVNVTFAIELYMKCLLIQETNKNKKTHELYLLFNMLSTESKTIITSDFQSRLSSDSTVKMMKNQLPDLKLDIQSILLAMNNAFKEWRYHSIDGKATSSVIGTEHLIFAIKKRIEELKSDK